LTEFGKCGTVGLVFFRVEDKTTERRINSPKGG